MRTTTKIVVSAVSVLGMSAMTLTGTVSGASATTKHQAVEVVSHSLSGISAKATIAYWTPARMRSAKVVDTLVARAPQTSSPVAKPSGKAAKVAGGLPAGVSAPRGGHASATSKAGPDTFSYPYPYDSFSVLPTTNYKKYPWEVNGAIFFTNDGGNYLCSGTSVASSSGSSDENEVWTAGHCTSNTDGTHLFDSSAIFIPAYNGALSLFDPKGEFVVSNLETTSAWLNNGDFSEDVGAMIVGTSTKAPHKTLGNAVGWDGFAWNQPVSEQFVTFGYPAASPYNGESMIEDIGATAVSDTGIGGAGSPPTGIGSPLTGGSSGGAWNIDWSDTGPGYINGHNDYKYSDQPLAMYSPYQDTLANTVRCFGASSC
jgi:V8-like Glu-specific endopeptidase